MQRRGARLEDLLADSASDSAWVDELNEADNEADDEADEEAEAELNRLLAEQDEVEGDARPARAPTTKASKKTLSSEKAPGRKRPRRPAMAILSDDDDDAAGIDDGRDDSDDPENAGEVGGESWANEAAVRVAPSELETAVQELMGSRNVSQAGRAKVLSQAKRLPRRLAAGQSWTRPWAGVAAPKSVYWTRS